MNTRLHREACGNARGRRVLALLTLSVVLAVLPRAVSANSPPVVSAVRAIPFGPVTAQRVIVRFDLADADGDELHVTVELYDNNGTTFLAQCTNTDPAPGSVFAAGADRTIIWNAQAEFPGHAGSEYVLKVVADDGVTPSPVGFVLIPRGTFTMGSPTSESGRQGDETQHLVTLTHDFHIQTTEVTNQQYAEMAQWAYDQGYITVTSASLRDNLDGSTQILKTLGTGGYEISFIDGNFVCINPEDPVKFVTWYGAVAYCDWLSLRHGLSRAYSHATWLCNGADPHAATGYRLPTEAEWEYACRAGSTLAFSNGSIANLNCNLDPNLEQVGWYCGNAGGWTHPVAQKLPSVYGLFDMHGNLCEWCNDWYGAYGSDVTDPVGPGTGSERVRRGGYWAHYSQYCRSADRGSNGPSDAGSAFGFRPVKSVH